MIARSGHTTPRVQEALDCALGRLAGTAEAPLAARMLLAHVLACSTTHLFVHPERALSAAEWAAYQRLIARRARHEPVAYLLGRREFLGLDLEVDRRVLVPRPETERLVEEALAAARRWPQPRIVDVGTGSGAIAISLAVHLPRACVWASDRSTGALEVARRNAERHGVVERIHFLHGDLCSPLQTQVEILVANLPYVSQAEYAILAPDIRLYEPREALVAGEDGLDAIRALLRQAPAYLAPQGVALIEISAGQGQAVSDLGARAFPGAQIDVLPDYAGLDRVARIQVGGTQQNGQDYAAMRGDV
jgi:release factor glutamine methyltransferase